MNIEKTKLYYTHLRSDDVCDCLYCQNYVREIKSAYPKVAEYLSSMGVDIEKPFETAPLEPDEAGYIEYILSDYIVYGDSDDFNKTTIDSVDIDITDLHPSTEINEAHFVIEIGPIRLKWMM